MHWFDIGGMPGPSHRRHDGKGSAVPCFARRTQLRAYEQFEPGVQLMRDQLINFLQAAVLFLLMTNALSLAAAAYAIRTVHGLTSRRIFGQRSGTQSPCAPLRYLAAQQVMKASG
jgi:hypothetical protein